MARAFRLRAFVMTVLVSMVGCACEAHSQSALPLMLERTISLPNVKGRIDHLEIDASHQRLYVAEVGNGTVEAIDLASGHVSGRISGLDEPQGIGYLAASNELVVASADGVVGFYRADDLSPIEQISLGDDADDVRIDPSTGSAIIGYGRGGLAILSGATRKVSARIALPAHPEGLQIGSGRRVFVNLPGAGKIGVVDLSTMKLTATRSNKYAANYPMAFDPSSNAVAVVYRLPARLVIADADTGSVRQDLDVCGDSDDLFLDANRKRIYVSCGSGDVDVFEASPDGHRRAARIKTRLGARTSQFSPELDRLYVAAPAKNGEPAAILVFRPSPASG